MIIVTVVLLLTDQPQRPVIRPAAAAIYHDTGLINTLIKAILLLPVQVTAVRTSLSFHLSPGPGLGSPRSELSRYDYVTMFGLLCVREVGLRAYVLALDMGKMEIAASLRAMETVTASETTH
eukprot:191850-Rhodomonas_salina.1